MMFRDEDHFHGVNLHLARLARFLIRHRRKALALELILFLASLWAIAGMSLHDDPNQWPPKYDANVQLNDWLQRDFGGANLVTIMITRKDGGSIINHDTLTVVKRITDQLMVVRGVIPDTVRSLSSVSARYLKGTAEMLEASLLFPEATRAPQTPGELARTEFGIENNAALKDILVSPDFKSVIIQADFRTDHMVTHTGMVLPSTDPIAIYKEVRRIIALENDAMHDVKATGSPVTIGWVNSDGQFYMAIALVFSMVIIAATLWHAFRTVSGVILPMRVAILGALMGFGLYRLFFGPTLYALAALLAPVIVVAVGACHSVQFLWRFFYEECPRLPNTDDAIVTTVVAKLQPMLLSLLCALVPFIVMAIIPFDNVRQLGMVTGLGLFSLTFAEFFFTIPALSSVTIAEIEKSQLRAREEREATAFDERLAKFARRIISRPVYGRLVLAASALLAVALAWEIAKTPVGQDNTFAIHNYLTKSWNRSDVFKMRQEIREDFGVDTLTVLAEGPTPGAVMTLEALTALEHFAQHMEELDQVRAVVGLPLYIKITNRFLNEDRDEEFRIPTYVPVEGFAACCHAGPFSGAPGAFDAIVDPSHQRAIMVAFVTDTSQDTVRRVSDRAQEYLTKIWDPKTASGVQLSMAGGSVGIAGAFNRHIRYWLILGAALGFVGTLIVSIPFIGSVLLAVLLIIPLLLGMLAAVGLMIALGIELNSNATAALAIASGVGINSEVYLLYRVHEEYLKSRNFRDALVRGFVKIWRALMISNGALILGCWALAPTPLYVGYVGFGMGLVLLLCFIFSGLISPILWNWLSEKTVVGKMEAMAGGQRMCASEVVLPQLGKQ